jgi:two-component system response regulator
VTEPVEILLVEDNPNDVELTLHALKRANVANRIEVARDGAEALEFIFGTGARADLQNHPGMILLDLKLPKVDGMEVLRRVKEDPRTRPIPVIRYLRAAFQSIREPLERRRFPLRLWSETHRLSKWCCSLA